MTERYLEDFAVGQVFNTGRLHVGKEQIFAFARQFDPQPFHVDETAAAIPRSRDWRRAAGTPRRLTMRLVVEGEFKPAGGILGVGFDELSWPRAVRPGDELHVDSEVPGGAAVEIAARTAAWSACAPRHSTKNDETVHGVHRQSVGAALRATLSKSDKAARASPPSGRAGAIGGYFRR